MPGVHRIGTAAALTGVDARRLRSWEAAGLLAPRRSAAGHRVFTDRDLDDIARVRDEVRHRGRFGAHLLAAAGEAPLVASCPTTARWPSVARAVAEATAAPWAAIVARDAERGTQVTGTWGVDLVPPSREHLDGWSAALLRSPFAVPAAGLAGVPGDALLAIDVTLDGWRAAVVLPRTGVDLGALPASLVRSLVATQRRHDLDAVDLARARAELHAVGELAGIIVRERQLQPLLEGALDLLLELTGLDMGGVLLVDRPRRRLVSAATRNVSPRYLDGIRNWRADEGIIGRAHTSGSPVTARDLRTDLRVTRAAVREEGVRGFIGVPLLHRGRSLGVVELGARAPRRFAVHEVSALARCAHQLAVAVAALPVDSPAAVAAAPERHPGSRSSHGLSERQTAILQLLAEAYTTDEVAALVGVAPKTVANALSATFRILGVSNRTQAVAEAIRRGLVAPDAQPA